MAKRTFTVTVHVAKEFTIHVDAESPLAAEQIALNHTAEAVANPESPMHRELEGPWRAYSVVSDISSQEGDGDIEQHKVHGDDQEHDVADPGLRKLLTR